MVRGFWHEHHAPDFGIRPIFSGAVGHNNIFFSLDYVMIAFFILAFVAWKAIRRTTYIKPGTANIENTSQDGSTLRTVLYG